jgi:hypothetical protein
MQNQSVKIFEYCVSVLSSYGTGVHPRSSTSPFFSRKLSTPLHPPTLSCLPTVTWSFSTPATSPTERFGRLMSSREGALLLPTPLSGAPAISFPVVSWLAERFRRSTPRYCARKLCQDCVTVPRQWYSAVEYPLALVQLWRAMRSIGIGVETDPSRVMRQGPVRRLLLKAAYIPESLLHPRPRSYDSIPTP